jgi:Flp pilus assembly protein CpaB
MRARSLFLLLLALGCGLVASIGITQVMARRDSSPADTGEKQTILIAKKDIPMGEPISATLVAQQSCPAANVPPGAFSTLADVEGRRAKTVIPANMPITENLLLGRGAGDQLASSAIPLGKVLSTVKVEAQSAAGNLIRPGDTVNVLVFVKADPMRGIVRTATKTILQNVRVFAINDVYDISSTAGADKSLSAKTISLIVTPGEAELIALASKLGDVSLALRSPEDKDIKSLAGHDARELFGEPSPGGDRDRSKTDVAGILKDLVESKPPPPSPVATAAVEEPNKTFTVRMLAGSQVTDVVLEAPPDSKGSKEAGQFDFWKIGSPQPTSNAAPHAGPPTVPPLVGPAVDQPAAEPPAAEGGKAGKGGKAEVKPDKKETQGDKAKS